MHVYLSAFKDRFDCTEAFPAYWANHLGNLCLPAMARGLGAISWSDGPSQAAARGLAARAPEQRRGRCSRGGSGRFQLWSLACLEEALGAVAARSRLLLGIGAAAAGAVCLYGEFVHYGVFLPLGQFYGDCGAVVVLLCTAASGGYLAGAALGPAAARLLPAYPGVDLGNSPASEDPAA